MDRSLELIFAAGIGAAVGAVVVAVGSGRTPDPEVRLAKSVSVKQRSSSQRTARQLNASRLRCSDCGMETSPGPMAQHQRAQGHQGTVKA